MFRCGFPGICPDHDCIILICLVVDFQVFVVGCEWLYNSDMFHGGFSGICRGLWIQTKRRETKAKQWKSAERFLKQTIDISQSWMRRAIEVLFRT